MSNKTDRNRRLVGQLTKELERGNLKQRVKSKKRRKRGHSDYKIGDYVHSKEKDYPSVSIKGKLPFKTWDQMRHVTGRKVWYEAPEYLPPDIARQYKGLLHERYMSRRFHKYAKKRSVEGTLRALENKYS